jgi:5-oxopent-3-ene-1,2,5-tricarboxylate decarboxylase/2-hydroxyhepta-2,4-diene-1,7-dioate isomerase
MSNEISTNKVIALAYNYSDLNAEFNVKFPLVFIKSNNTINKTGKVTIKHLIEDNPSLEIWSEVELGFVISKPCRNISKKQAYQYIDGFLIANDVTRRNIENRDHHLALSKSLDGFCPISDYIITDVDTSNLCLTTRINGIMTQNGNTANRIFDDTTALEYISRFFTLDKGDIILTGTPKGAMDSLVKVGDVVELEIEKIGKMINYFI